MIQTGSRMERAGRLMRYWATTVGMLWCITLAGFQAEGVFTGDREHAAIRYSTGPERNAIAELNARLRQSSANLQFEGRAGYLRSVLDALQLPVESQMMVFSKTSLQKA